MRHRVCTLHATASQCCQLHCVGVAGAARPRCASSLHVANSLRNGASDPGPELARAFTSATGDASAGQQPRLSPPTFSGQISQAPDPPSMRSNTQATICCSFVRTLQTLVEQSTTISDTRESFAFEPARLIASLVKNSSVYKSCFSMLQKGGRTGGRVSHGELNLQFWL
jgi:hypothetical protein